MSGQRYAARSRQQLQQDVKSGFAKYSNTDRRNRASPSGPGAPGAQRAAPRNLASRRGGTAEPCSFIIDTVLMRASARLGIARAAFPKQRPVRTYHASTRYRTETQACRQRSSEDAMRCDAMHVAARRGRRSCRATRVHRKSDLSLHVSSYGAWDPCRAPAPRA